MRLDLYQDGVLKMTIQSVGDVVGDDFAVLPKRLVKGCTLSPESFDNLFFECLKEVHTHVKAYEKAESIHQEYFGSTKYQDYNSFRNSKSQRLKK